MFPNDESFDDETFLMDESMVAAAGEPAIPLYMMAKK